MPIASPTVIDWENGRIWDVIDTSLGSYDEVVKVIAGADGDSDDDPSDYVASDLRLLICCMLSSLLVLSMERVQELTETVG